MGVTNSTTANLLVNAIDFSVRDTLGLHNCGLLVCIDLAGDLSIGMSVAINCGLVFSSKCGLVVDSGLNLGIACMYVVAIVCGISDQKWEKELY